MSHKAYNIHVTYSIHVTYNIHVTYSIDVTFNIHVPQTRRYVRLTVKTAQDSAEWPPPWSSRSTGPWEPLQYSRNTWGPSQGATHTLEGPESPGLSHLALSRLA